MQEPRSHVCFVPLTYDVSLGRYLNRHPSCSSYFRQMVMHEKAFVISYCFAEKVCFLCVIGILFSVTMALPGTILFFFPNCSLLTWNIPLMAVFVECHFRKPEFGSTYPWSCHWSNMYRYHKPSSQGRLALFHYKMRHLGIFWYSPNTLKITHFRMDAFCRLSAILYKADNIGISRSLAQTQVPF